MKPPGDALRRRGAGSLESDSAVPEADSVPVPDDLKPAGYRYSLVAVRSEGSSTPP